MSNLPRALDIATFVAQVHAAARGATSEAALQFALDGLLRQLLAEYGVNYRPTINTGLSAVGLSEVSSDRPDSLFGHVILDYKLPGSLSQTPKLAASKEQIERYLNEVTQGGPAQNPKEADTS